MAELVQVVCTSLKRGDGLLWEVNGSEVCTMRERNECACRIVGIAGVFEEGDSFLQSFERGKSVKRESWPNLGREGWIEGGSLKASGIQEWGLERDGSGWQCTVGDN
jgi:hypothetical protein